eukprot:3757409-Rhodomonas_salina.2
MTKDFRLACFDSRQCGQSTAVDPALHLLRCETLKEPHSGKCCTTTRRHRVEDVPVRPSAGPT